jgi:Hypoxia induced protein conserved region
MNHIFFGLAGLFMILTLVVCTTGIILMASGGEMNKKYGTKLMAARVYCQAIAIFFIVVAFS